MKTFEEWLAELGVDVATLSEADEAALQLAFDTLQMPPTVEQVEAMCHADLKASLAAMGKQTADTIRAEAGQTGFW